ncbi:hypothetical protein [Synechococcus sp. CS-1332]|uniref:hypothetical protein n=1 Tax=Synechococcus sp. CS-1332 TaxID=2847972 RepID=UPI00223B1AD7|nr:hypothetical protein [Synechococcus sp. CS-1332]MCT0208501.1 hypothetical protein [Synechococcus sp. CS-1332]
MASHNNLRHHLRKNGRRVLATATVLGLSLAGDAVVNLGATEKKSIDEGSTSLADVKKYGLSFNGEVRGKKINGCCNVNGKGTITEFKQGL